MIDFNTPCLIEVPGKVVPASLLMQDGGYVYFNRQPNQPYRCGYKGTRRIAVARIINIVKKPDDTNTNRKDPPRLSDPANNIHQVSSKTWRRWSDGARKMFNYLYAQGVANKSLVSDLFPDTPENEEAIRMAAHNLALMAADFHDKLP